MHHEEESHQRTAGNHAGHDAPRASAALVRAWYWQTGSVLVMLGRSRYLLILALMLHCGVVAATPRLAAQASYPIYFEVNRGQAPADVAFLSRGAAHTLRLTATGAEMILHGAAGTQALVGKPLVVRITPVDARVAGAARPRGEGVLPGRSHYFTQGRAENALTGIEHFRAVRYPQLYPGIDMRFHGERGRLEFDFVLQPGVDPGRIALEISGAEHRSLDGEGNLVLRAGGRELALHAPVTFQDIDGTRLEVNSRFAMREDGMIGFEVGGYDRSHSLTIDPVLGFSSYAGGSATDVAQDIAFDAQGNLYVVGETYSTDFPTHDPYQASSPVNGSAFVMKLDAQTRDLVYATYLGSNVTEARGIAVDTEGSAYIVGDTSSTSFPLANPYQASLSGLIDIFVSRLSPGGDALTYSTYLGGDQVDRGRAIAVDPVGDIYITGVTSSTDFPLANPQQTSRRGSTDAYVAKLSPSRGTLDYSTYLGGGALDYGTSIAVDEGGVAFVGGYTGSINFPTLDPFQGARAGSTDAFVARFGVQGDLDYSTYLGGAGVDRVHAIALDTEGGIHLAGETDSADFPVVDAFQETLAGATDAFVSRLDASGASLQYATYLGGAGNDVAFGMGLDAAGTAYLAGMTQSSDFPVLQPVQAANAGGQDAFVTQLSAGGGQIEFSTYLGGGADEYAHALAVDAGGAVGIAGRTASADFPLADANQWEHAGNLDAFIAVLLADAGAPDITSLLRLLRIIGGLVVPTPQDLAWLDMNGDGALDIRDVLQLQRSLWGG